MTDKPKKPSKDNETDRFKKKFSEHAKPPTPEQRALGNAMLGSLIGGFGRGLGDMTGNLVANEAGRAAGLREAVTFLLLKAKKLSPSHRAIIGGLAVELAERVGDPELKALAQAEEHEAFGEPKL